ncbi:hypothetical protein [Ammoniphilus resinae]|nr:hypothetical protein [Ammoniphilus resinae]
MYEVKILQGQWSQNQMGSFDLWWVQGRDSLGAGNGKLDRVERTQNSF